MVAKRTKKSAAGKGASAAKAAPSKGAKSGDRSTKVTKAAAKVTAKPSAKAPTKPSAKAAAKLSAKVTAKAASPAGLGKTKPSASKTAASVPAAGKAAPSGKTTPAPTKKSQSSEKRSAAVAAAPRAKVLSRAEASLPSTTAEASEPLTVPDFSLFDQDGTLVESHSLRGAPYVLYFYPKDDTPGCTKQACGFNETLREFETSGARVIGVSPDSQSSHAKFRSKYSLAFTLLSDPETALARALGVYKLKQNYGRQYMGIERSTFLVDSSGEIRKIWRAVRVAGHVPAVLEALRSLAA